MKRVLRIHIITIVKELFSATSYRYTSIVALVSMVVSVPRTTDGSFTSALLLFATVLLLLAPSEKANAFLSPCHHSAWHPLSRAVTPQQQPRLPLVLAASSIEKEVAVVTPDRVVAGADDDDDSTKIKQNDRTKNPIDEKREHSEGKSNDKLKVVLVAGFESFNRDLYYKASEDLDVQLVVFADSEIRLPASASEGDGSPWKINPRFAHAVQTCDAFVGSLIFDYDDAVAVQSLLPQVSGPRLLFECATELMPYNHMGSFSMMPASDSATPAGPPPAVKAILSKFGSGKEEDKLSGYLQLLKFGPDLLKFVPGEKAGDLRAWLEAYRYWNQGGKRNFQGMLQLIASRCKEETAENLQLPELVVTPDIGIVHPLRYNTFKGQDIPDPSGGRLPDRFFESSPAKYLSWRLASSTKQLAERHGFHLAPDHAPRVAVLLFRKHVITEQKYVPDLIAMMEEQGVIPIPIFINGVEAHTIVRDLLTSEYEMEQVEKGILQRDSTYQSAKAVAVDAIVNTVGFPLVGGPAGSMEAGRNVAVAEQLLSAMNVPYIVASPLLLQTIPQWKQNGVLGLQSVVLYSLPELDGAIDSVVLGGLVGDKIALVPERVRTLTHRLKSWVELRRTPPKDRKIAIALYGFPPNVGAVGTAALLDVPHSLEALLRRLHEEGYNTGNWYSDPDASGESLVAALSIMCENPVVTAGADNIQSAIDAKIARAVAGDQTVAATLARPGAGLAGATVRAKNVSPDELEKMLGKYMFKKVRRAWSEKDRGPGVSAKGDYVVAGLQIGNVWIFVQPLLGVEGDPMRLLFERDLTPHPQYTAAYKWLCLPESQGGIGAQALLHLGMHGTVEWLPGQALGNDRASWSDELVDLPNVYVYAANNPSESILAKRRGYGSIVSYNVPPYGRAGLYLELKNLRELVDEYRAEAPKGSVGLELCQTIFDLAQRSGMTSDVPLLLDPSDDQSTIQGSELPKSVIESDGVFAMWVLRLSDYLNVLQDRLFSSGLRVLGARPRDEELDAYLEAFFGDRLSDEERSLVISKTHALQQKKDSDGMFHSLISFIRSIFGDSKGEAAKDSSEHDIVEEAFRIASLLLRSTEEMESVLGGLDGRYIKPKPGGDLLRDGPGVLPTGRNIHALDPYRMPSASAWSRGQKAAEEIIRQHKASSNGKFPETVAVTLWGLDAIKTRGESVAIVLALVGAKPVKEGTGRIVRYDLIPLSELGRPRVDVLCSLSGIFRDSFANVVDLLDDMFERCASANEPVDMNFIKKHANELVEDGVKERTAARLFSNPPGDYGSMVNEVVGTGEWDKEESLGETWRGRNVYSYGRNEGGIASSGTARPAVLDKLLSTTERVVQEIDSVEYGLIDIQEYYANTGALKKAAENRKEIDPRTGFKKKVSVSVIEAFGGSSENATVPVKDVEDVLRMEYRSKLLNPKWRDSMLNQGSGGAYEISQRMTAMIGWAATSKVDKFVFDQAAQRYTEDEGVAQKLQRSNPEAFKNVVRRLLEAAGRGMWDADDETLDRLRDLYSDADDLIEQGTAR